MNFLRRHWFDVGSILGVAAVFYVYACFPILSYYQAVMWLSFASLCFHQLEEYRLPGTFAGMLNTTLFKSQQPDRYPLNTNTALIVNVVIGWGTYLAAALLAEKAVWLGLASILVSAGNVVAHTFLFNIKGKTIYNAGLITCWLLFAPMVYFFFYLVMRFNLATTSDYVTGIALGIILNVVGILKMIDWLANKNSPYIFEQRQLLRKDRHFQNR